MCLGLLRILFELIDQTIVRKRLAQSIPGVERHQKEKRGDGYVIGRGSDFPKLSPIHYFNSFTSCTNTTGAGPEMPPSFRTRQKCTAMKIATMKGMAMQCQM